MTNILKRPWLLCEEEVGCVLVDLGDLGRPDLLQVDVNSCLIDEEVEAVAQHVVDLHNASLTVAADPWIELASLGEPVTGVWPWTGDPVLVHCRSLVPGEPGATGQARYWVLNLHGRPPQEWKRGWWWAGSDPYRTDPNCETYSPVTHVRQIVPPVGG